MSEAAGPSLIELAQDPARAATVPLEAVPALLAQLAALQSALAARLLAAPNGAPAPEAPVTDRLLTAAQTAPLLGVAPSWLYRHAPTLPFVRRLSRKALRFSEAGVRRWQAIRRH